MAANALLNGLASAQATINPPANPAQAVIQQGLQQAMNPQSANPAQALIQHAMMQSLLSQQSTSPDQSTVQPNPNTLAGSPFQQAKPISQQLINPVPTTPTQQNSPINSIFQQMALNNQNTNNVLHGYANHFGLQHPFLSQGLGALAGSGLGMLAGALIGGGRLAPYGVLGGALVGAKDIKQNNLNQAQMLLHAHLTQQANMLNQLKTITPLVEGMNASQLYNKMMGNTSGFTPISGPIPADSLSSLLPLVQTQRLQPTLQHLSEFIQSRQEAVNSFNSKISAAKNQADINKAYAELQSNYPALDKFITQNDLLTPDLIKTLTDTSNIGKPITLSDIISGIKVPSEISLNQSRGGFYNSYENYVQNGLTPKVQAETKNINQRTSNSQSQEPLKEQKLKDDIQEQQLHVKQLQQKLNNPPDTSDKQLNKLLNDTKKSLNLNINTALQNGYITKNKGQIVWNARPTDPEKGSEYDYLKNMIPTQQNQLLIFNKTFGSNSTQTASKSAPATNAQSWLKQHGIKY